MPRTRYDVKRRRSWTDDDEETDSAPIRTARKSVSHYYNSAPYYNSDGEYRVKQTARKSVGRPACDTEEHDDDAWEWHAPSPPDLNDLSGSEESIVQTARKSLGQVSNEEESSSTQHSDLSEEEGYRTKCTARKSLGGHLACNTGSTHQDLSWPTPPDLSGSDDSIVQTARKSLGNNYTEDEDGSLDDLSVSSEDNGYRTKWTARKGTAGQSNLSKQLARAYPPRPR